MHMKYRDSHGIIHRYIYKYLVAKFGRNLHEIRVAMCDQTDNLCLRGNVRELFGVIDNHVGWRFACTHGLQTHEARKNREAGELSTIQGAK